MRFLMRSNKPVLKPWLLSVMYLPKSRPGILNQASYKFWSEARTVQEAFEAIYAAGFVCVTRNPDGTVVAAGSMSVRLSMGDL